MLEAGVLVASETLQPSARGVRLRYAGGERTWIDGPFAESKELIGGFAIFKCASVAEVAGWADQFAKVIGDVELDICPLD